MIYGKPISLGGGQGLMAEILCTGDVLSTDTVIATKGLQAVSGIWMTDHFIIGRLDLGTWTVTVTRGGQTKTYEVLIDEVAQYEVVITYITYLYNLGDECEDITGGWTAYKKGSSSATKNSDNLAHSSPNMYDNSTWITNNLIDFSKYTKVYIEYTLSKVYAACRICNAKTADPEPFSYQTEFSVGTHLVHTHALVDWETQTPRYMGITTWAGNNIIYRVWLE